MIEIKNSAFGKTSEGKRVSCWTLTNENGMSAEILTYGGTLRALHVPVGGVTRDVVLGFDGLAGYEAQTAYIGALVGRVANRIGSARFALDGREYRLSANSGPNCLHGGTHGFDKKNWAAELADGALTLSYVSPDGEEGFPGTLTVRVTYTLGEDNALSIDYRAQSNAPTVVSMTNHSYFNLNGAGAGTVEDHRVQIIADRYNECDADVLATGNLLAVGDSPFDLREPKLLGHGLTQDHPQLVLAGGYDHNFVLKSGMDGVLRSAAVAACGGLRMECLTTQPGIQLYTGNFLTELEGKGGKSYGPRSALCLETQNWPDAIHHPHFPSPILRPGEVYRQRTVYRFTEE